MDGQWLGFTCGTWMERWIINCMVALGKLFPIVLLCLPAVALADGKSYYDRKEALCEALYYEPHCTLEFENEKYKAEVYILL
jgi:hypothetical protein